MDKHPLINNKLEKLFEVPNPSGKVPIISKQIEDRQYDVLDKLVKMCFCPNMNVVEIGGWAGCSAVILGSVIQRCFGKLYSIDWYKGDNINDGYLKEVIDKEINVSEIFKRNIEYFNLNDTVELKIMSSEEASKLFQDETLDFIFIDGCHIYEEVVKDIELWYPKLKPNKIISGHDYNMSSVQKAVNHKFFKINVTVEEHIWWIRKPL